MEEVWKGALRGELCGELDGDRSTAVQLGAEDHDDNARAIASIQESSKREKEAKDCKAALTNAVKSWNDNEVVKEVRSGNTTADFAETTQIPALQCNAEFHRFHAILVIIRSTIDNRGSFDGLVEAELVRGVELLRLEAQHRCEAHPKPCEQHKI